MGSLSRSQQGETRLNALPYLRILVCHGTTRKRKYILRSTMQNAARYPYTDGDVHDKQTFADAQQRCRDLRRFVNFYNTVKPHSSLKGNTPFEVLETYFTLPVV